MAPYDTGELRRRRRRRIRGPVTLLVLVLMLSGAAWYGWDTVLNVPPAPTPTQVCATPKPHQKQRIDARDVTVNVYNAGRVTGLANRTAEQFREHGFTIGEVGNDPYNSNVRTVEVRGRAENAPELLIVAEHLADETRRGDNRTDTSVDVIVGDDFSGAVADGPATMEVDTPVPVCRTITPSPVALPRR